MGAPEKEYMEIVTELAETLDTLNIVWWTIEETLMGLLRWGSNFGLTSHQAFMTDNAIYIMVQIENESNWNHIQATLQKRWAKGNLGSNSNSNYSAKTRKDWSWQGCQPYQRQKLGVPGRRRPQLTCFTSTVFSTTDSVDKTDNNIIGEGREEVVHIDFHTYVVSNDSKTIAMDSICLERPSQCKLRWPFQAWGGAAPFRGLIVDEKGDFARVKMGPNMVWKSAHNVSSLMKLWNNREYDMKTLHLPPTAYCLARTKEWPMYRPQTPELSPEDILILCEESLQLYQDGYMSWHSSYSLLCEKESRDAGREVVGFSSLTKWTEAERMCTAYSQRRCISDPSFEGCASIESQLRQ